jgi:hypothetical protein
MTMLRDITKTQMADERELVKAARADALAALAAEVRVRSFGGTDSTAHLANDASQTPVMTSLKRKRSEDEEEVEVQRGDSSMDAVAGSGSGDSTDAAANAAVPVTPTPATAVHDGGVVNVRSPKRARRIATVVAQTATAVTIGAIATWSALAFS